MKQHESSTEKAKSDDTNRRVGSLRSLSTKSHDSTAKNTNSSTASTAQNALNEVGQELSKLAEKWHITNESPKTVTSGTHTSSVGKIQDDSNIGGRLTKTSVSRIKSERKLTAAPLINKSVRQRPREQCDQAIVPEMYKDAMRNDWVNVACRAITHPTEANYICPTSGSTVLHLAIISRASHGKCTSLEGHSIASIWNMETKVPANIDLIHALVKLSPNALKRRCKRLGYTPLVYALLQPRIDNYKEEFERLVGLLIGQETLRIATRTGMSPLEVYIGSYSQVHGTLLFSSTRDEAAARKTTNILRLLLESDGKDSNNNKDCRQVDRKVIGTALEVLYEWNSSSILHAVECASIASGRNNSLAMSDLNGWWVWQWLILLLELSIIHVEGRCQFSATHAAASLPHGCPLPLLMLLIRAFPIQARIPCPMTRTSQYVLHSVCCWGGTVPRNGDTVNYSRKQMALSAVLREFPAASSVTDSEGRTPLCLALQHRTMWNGGVSKLYKAFPGAIFRSDPQTGLLPFMVAAAAAPQMNDASINGDDSYKNTLQVWTIFELLRAAPEALSSCAVDNDDSHEGETESFLEFKRAAEQQSLAQILEDWSKHLSLVE